MKRPFYIILLLFFSINIFAVDLNPYKKHYRDFKEALGYIKNNETEKATEKMLDSLEEAEKSNIDDADLLNYDMGKLLADSDEKEKALEYYGNALNGMKDSKDKADTLYNMGNILYKDNRLKDAIQSYIESYRLNPTEDLKYNLNLAIRKLKQQQKQKEKQKEQQDKDDQKKEKEQDKKENEKRDKEDDDEDKENKEQEKQADDKKSKDMEDDKNEDFNQQQVIKNAEQQEKEALKQFIKKELGEVDNDGKDW